MVAAMSLQKYPSCLASLTLSGITNKAAMLDQWTFFACCHFVNSGCVSTLPRFWSWDWEACWWIMLTMPGKTLQFPQKCLPSHKPGCLALMWTLQNSKHSSHWMLGHTTSTKNLSADLITTEHIFGTDNNLYWRLWRGQPDSGWAGCVRRSRTRSLHIHKSLLRASCLLRIHLHYRPAILKTIYHA